MYKTERMSVEYFTHFLVSMTNLKLETAHVKAGSLGGLVGGIIFGGMMGMMGMLPMIAMLVKSESAVVGFFVHIIISIIFGVGYALFFGHAGT